MESVPADAARACRDGTLPAEAPTPADRDGLSTDYLNHYCEILMLIEMASFDDAVVAEIAHWQPVGYRDYFLNSPLRRAAAALDSYDALPEDRRRVLEQTIQALDKLALAAILALQPPCHPQNVVLIGEVIGPAIRRLIDRAADFLNSNGERLCDGCEADHAQHMIDRLIA